MINIEIGDRFGRLTIIAPANRSLSNKERWVCRCDCEAITIVLRASLLRGATKSCGCFGIDSRRARMTKHGMTLSAEHRTWSVMRSRCSNPKVRDYPRYGGRGISVCERWNSFEAFFEDMGIKPSPSHTIDRIDPNKDYTPENCRWATPKEQGNNTSRNIFVVLDGNRMTFKQAVERCGSKQYGAALYRFHHGYKLKDAIGYIGAERQQLESAAKAAE